jgi:hypothetical protein
MGEVGIAKGLIELAKTAKSEMVKLGAYDKLSKCLGLQKEVIEGGGGLTIIFEPPDGPQVERLPGPRPAGAITQALPGGKPLMITK